MAVLDALDAGTDSLPDCGRRIGMDGHVGAPICGGFDRGADLFLGKLRDVERIEIRNDAATNHEFDLTRTLHELLAHATQDFLLAIDDGRESASFQKVQRLARGSRDIVEGEC